MAVIGLDRFFEDTIVVHFGGKAGSIDAYTFAEALIGFADTAYAVSSVIDPGQEIENHHRSDRTRKLPSSHPPPKEEVWWHSITHSEFDILGSSYERNL
jgi:hypothetical protein